MDSGGLYTERRGRLMGWLFTSQIPNLFHVGLREFAQSLTLSTGNGAMNNLVGCILSRSGPPNVSRVAAGNMAVAAGMGRVMFGCRRWTVNFLASDPMNFSAPSLPRYPSISVAAFRERPYKTVIASIVENNIPKKGYGLAPELGPDKWIAMSVPAGVVRCTPSAPVGWLAAIINGAYRGVSHSSLLQRFVSVRARRWMAVLRRVRFMYHPLNADAIT